jgi:hypothetical protein
MTATGKEFAVARRAAKDAQLTIDWRQKLREFASQPDIDVAVQMIFEKVKPLLPTEAISELRCPAMQADAVKEAVHQRRTMMCGGALSALQLERCAYDYVQLSRVEWVFQEHFAGGWQSVSAMLGMIKVNVSLWDVNSTSLENLVRASSDSEYDP